MIIRGNEDRHHMKPQKPNTTRGGRLLLGTFWIGLYFLLTIGPLAIIYLGEAPPGRGFWIELSIALGFIGMAMITVQFVITARIDRINGPYGIDVIYQFHRQISILSITLILIHPIMLFAADPDRYLPLLRIWEAPLRAVLAWLGLLGLITIAATSIWRVKLGLSYETWRILHGILAVAVLALALGHVLGVGHYLEQFWQRGMWVGMAAIVVLVSGYVRLVKPLLMQRKPWRVVNVRRECGRSWTVELEPDGHRGLRFQPGQFAWVTFGRSVWMIREHPFSFSSSAERSGRVAFTIKENGDFTDHIGETKPGTPAYLDGPHGVFTIDRRPDVKGAVFIAGGIGVTPIMSMLRTLADREDSRRFVLIYGCPAWDQVTFRDEWSELEKRLDLKVIIVLDDPPEGWEGESGRIDEALLQRHLPEDRAAYEHYICGPPAMMASVREVLPTIGVPAERIEMEEFELA